MSRCGTIVPSIAAVFSRSFRPLSRLVGERASDHEGAGRSHGKEATAMTQFQESAPAPKLIPAERSYSAPFVAITAGLVVLLIALAAMSFVLSGRSTDVTIQGNTDTAAIDGHMAGLTAANGQARIASAQQLNDGWEAALVTRRATAVRDGWEAGLIRPHQPAVDGYIQRFLGDD